MTGSAKPSGSGAQHSHNDFSGSARDVVQVGVLNGPLFVDLLPPVADVWPEPHEVPAPTSGFVNRVLELADWTNAITAPDDLPRILLCSGMRGIGKSSFIKKFVDEHRERFVGGDLYVDFAEYSHRGGAAVSDAVASCLRSLGVPGEVIPDSLDERTRLFRSRTAHKPIMIVLEDVAEPAQVSALVPNSRGSVVLASSGHLLEELRFSHGARLTELHPLSADDSRRLLIELCDPDRALEADPAVDELIKYASGLPAALQLLAGRLMRSSALTPARLATELIDETRRIDGFTLTASLSVSAILNSSFAALSLPAQQVYRRLGTADLVSFDAAVCDLLAGPGAEAAVVREELFRSGLTLRDDRAAHRFHDLVRLHSKSLANQDSEHRQSDLESVRVLVNAFVATARRADGLIMSGRLRFGAQSQGGEVTELTTAVQSLAWFAAQRPNLMAMLRIAHVQAWNRETWQLAENLTAFFLNHRYIADWLESLTLGADAAEFDGRPDVQARFLLMSSRPLAQLGRRQEALQNVVQARVITETIGDLRLLASAWEFHGRLFEEVDERAAIESFTASRRLNEQADEPRGVALADFYRAMCLSRLDQKEAAMAILRECAEVFAALGDQRMRARVLACGAPITASLGQPAEGVRQLKEAIRIFVARDLQHYEARSLEDLADLLVVLQQDDEAVACWTRAYELYERTGDPRSRILQGRLASLAKPAE